MTRNQAKDMILDIAGELDYDIYKELKMECDLHPPELEIQSRMGDLIDVLNWHVEIDS
jgi:hypothetical protein